jgi:hypothetical protein
VFHNLYCFNIHLKIVFDPAKPQTAYVGVSTAEYEVLDTPECELPEDSYKYWLEHVTVKHQYRMNMVVVLTTTTFM